MLTRYTSFWSRLTLLAKVLLMCLVLAPIVVVTIALGRMMNTDVDAEAHRLPVARFAAGTHSLEPALVIEALPAPQAQPLQPAAVATENESFVHKLEVRRGETLTGLFARFGIVDREVLDILVADDTLRGPASRLLAGGIAVAAVAPGGRLVFAHLPLTRGQRLVLERLDGGVAAKLVDAASERYERLPEMRSATVTTSLFGAADDAGIPETVVVELAKALGTRIDFSRALQSGDRFSVIYETLHDRGVFIGVGKLLAVEFTHRDQVQRAYRHRSHDGREAYYQEDGSAISTGFLRYPLEFRRISDRFGPRNQHPVLGRWRMMHNGVDFAAPTGTLIWAASDGRVTFAGTRGGYGKTVIIEHRSGVQTLYAHLSRISVRSGQSVVQGQVLGLVGSTGLATGPHLHYEVRIAGRAHDPLEVALPMTGTPLRGEELKAFNEQIADARHRLDLLGALLASR